MPSFLSHSDLVGKELTRRRDDAKPIGKHVLQSHFAPSREAFPAEVKAGLWEALGFRPPVGAGGSRDAHPTFS
jgi:hypothetical protein